MHNNAKCEKVFYALGTQNSIIAYGKNAEEAIEESIKRVAEIHNRLTAFDINSEVSQITEKAGIRPVKVCDEVLYILENALMFSKKTRGAFDLTIRPLTALWKIGESGGIVPSLDKINKAKALVGWNCLKINKRCKTAFLKRRGQAINLGGIAKGYAADEVKRLLVGSGISRAIINLGGNIVTLSEKHDGEPWTVGIQNPLAQRGEYAASIRVHDRSIVTSAVNERFFVKDGIRYHHIIDPVTGYPVENELLSVTIISDSSMLGDALSTAIFALGIERGIGILEREGCEAVFILKSGEIFSTFNMVDRVMG